MHLVTKYRRVINDAAFIYSLEPTYAVQGDRQQLAELLHIVAQKEFSLKRIDWPFWAKDNVAGLAWGTRQEYSINPRVKGVDRLPHTLIHEIAHCLFGHGNDSATRWKRELEAEAVAYLVDEKLGNSFHNWSACYIANGTQRKRKLLWEFGIQTEPNVMMVASDIFRAIQRVS